MPANPIKPNAVEQSPAEYKVAIDAHAEAVHRTATAFVPYEQATPNMTVRLAAGAILSGTTITEVAAQNTATITAPSTNPRIDRVVIDKTTGAVSVVAGSEEASPSAPDIPAGKLPVARVALTVGMTAITNSDIADERIGGGSGPELAQDLSSPAEDVAPSTQAVVDAFAALASSLDLAMLNAILLGKTVPRASTALPKGYLWTFQTDELATKTGASYDSGSKLYGSTVAASVDITPLMTGATTSGFTASASSVLGAGFEAWRAFNNATGDDGAVNVGWLANAGAAWLVMDCGSAQGISGYTIQAGSNYYASRSPSAWTFEGSNTGAFAGEQVVLDTQTGQGTWSSTQKKSYLLGATANYRYYRFNITANNGGGAYVGLVEAELLGVGSVSNLDILPTAITAGSAPDVVDLYIVHRPVDAATINTDIKARVSRDGGSNWSDWLTLALVCPYDSASDLLKGTADLSALATGTSIKWEIATYNTKNQQIKAVALMLG